MDTEGNISTIPRLSKIYKCPNMLLSGNALSLTVKSVFLDELVNLANDNMEHSLQEIIKAYISFLHFTVM